MTAAPKVKAPLQASTQGVLAPKVGSSVALPLASVPPVTSAAAGIVPIGLVPGPVTGTGVAKKAIPAVPAAASSTTPTLGTTLLRSPAPAPGLAARVGALEQALEANPYDALAWEARVQEAAKLEGKSKAEEVFERALKQLPMAAKLWILYAEWGETNAEVEETQNIYNRCLEQILNVDLWSAYVNFCKRFQPLEQILKSYILAVDRLGTDPRAGAIWGEFMCILKHAYNVLQMSEDEEAEAKGMLLSEDPSPIELARQTLQPDVRQKLEIAKVHDMNDETLITAMEKLGINVNFVRTMFQRCTCSPHSSLDKLWANYEQFEKSHGNTQLASKLLGEYMPRYWKAKNTWKELQPISAAVDYSAVAVPITAKNAKQQSSLADQWRKLLLYERSNPIRLEPEGFQTRVIAVYQQAILVLAYHADIWYDFHVFLDQCGHKQKATETLQEAVKRFLPQDLTLRLLIAQRLELSATPATEQSLKAAEECYKKLLDEMPKPCPLALINYLSFIRRQYRAQDFRECFLEATQSSEHCTWEVYAFVANVEHHVFDSHAAATQTFKLGMERYGKTEPALLASFVNFLLGVNDFRSARAALSSGVLERLESGVRDRLANRTDPVARDSLALLWQKWARLEVYFGDAGALQRVVDFRDTEYQRLQVDQGVEEEAVTRTPASLGLSTTIKEVEESFRFLHLVPHAARTRLGDVGRGADVQDQAVDDATVDHQKLSTAFATSVPMNVVRPDTSKMLSFKPTMDTAPRRKVVPGVKEAGMNLTLIPKCLQDLLAVLPSTPLKGARPDVDYLLTTLQQVHIPPVPVKELEQVRYDSLRISKDSEGRMVKKRATKDDMDGDGNFFSMRSSAYRDKLHGKRQRLSGEPGGGLIPTKAEASA